MIAEYLQVARQIKSIPGTPRTFDFESSTPYRHVTMWVWVNDGGTVNITAQPKFGGVNDGSSTVITDDVPNKVFQVTVEEVRPANRALSKHIDDSSIAESIKTELEISNTLATALTATYTWDGTTTIASGDTSEVVIGDWIRLDSDGQWFEIIDIDPNVDVTIANPDGLTIPSGATQSSVSNETQVSVYILATATPGGA